MNFYVCGPNDTMLVFTAPTRKEALAKAARYLRRKYGRGAWNL